MSNDQRLSTYWGYKFEALCTLPTRSPSSEELASRNQTIVNNHAQYGVVSRTRLGKHSIIMGAEVDCVMDRGDKKTYVELKTSKEIQHPKQQSSFERHKLLKFWAQSFLIGVPIITVGFRDNHGILRSLRSFDTLHIPRIVRGKPGMWNPNVCLNFADALLSWIKSIIKNGKEDRGNPRTTWTIAFKEPFKEVTLEYAGEKNSFLPEKYIEKMDKDNTPIVI
ncbi:uncharacterized protein VTP21DRAFT_9002 [Calcarisporiella thermophila]|uniref:uncharacterized protein n=1 Tax=Calcarisporiella thermophila TaxID=911321 RepID=UPI003743EA09